MVLIAPPDALSLLLQLTSNRPRSPRLRRHRYSSFRHQLHRPSHHRRSRLPPRRLGSPPDLPRRSRLGRHYRLGLLLAPP
ncbi:hypothetical protein ACSBR2_031742 [Camellia fascicularis]